MNKKRVLVALALLVFAFTLFIGFFTGLYVGIFVEDRVPLRSLSKGLRFRLWRLVETRRLRVSSSTERRFVINSVG